QLRRRFREIRILLSSPNWGNKENNLLEYKLSGSEPGAEEWTAVDINNEILIGQLDAGSYVLHIRKRIGFGIDNYSVITYRFNVEQSFTESWLFGLLLVFGAFVIAFVIFYIRTRLLLAQKKNLEALVAVQTMKLEQALYIKNKLISGLSHDISTPLQFILLIAKQMGRILDKDPAAVMNGLGKIEQASIQLINLSNDLLNWMKIQDENMQLRSDHILLRDLVEEKCEFFAGLAEERKVMVRNNVAETSTCYSDRRLLSIIIHNILSNAIKFTIRGEVTINSARFADAIVIIVQDTGMGIHKGHLEQINNHPDDATSPGTSNLVGKGIGLIMTGDIAKLLGIKLEFLSAKDKGTRVNITIPLNYAEHRSEVM
ncbi:MAG: HAMP domain-containing sensor histidine kinase, partial [Flavitalea sp.]